MQCKKAIVFLCATFLLCRPTFAQEELGTGIRLPEIAENKAAALWQNVDFSFFGTAAYAISNKPYKYDKISNHGTFDSGSRLGAQVDWQITPRLGLTLQGELAPSTSDDHRWRPQLQWASLNLRLTDNWLVRVGHQRLPALLYTQNANVGISYVPARLPVEVYNLSPTFSYNGIASTYTWDVGDDGTQTLAWDFYAGTSNFWQRVWFRDSYPNYLNQGANYFSRKMNAVGTFFTYEDLMEGNIIRTGVHYVIVRDRQGGDFMKRNAIMQTPYGKVYMPIGGDRSSNVKWLLFGVLADWHLGNGFYATGEFGVRRAMNMTTGLSTRAAYVQLRRRFNQFTPYISFAYSHSDSKANAAHRGMTQVTGIESIDMLNRMSADAMVMNNQSTFAIGTAYDIGTNHRLKLEYARTHLGSRSSLVDQTLQDGDLVGNGINIFTASYNFLF